MNEKKPVPSLLSVMKRATFVSLESIHDDNAWYMLMCASEDETKDGSQHELTFGIPLEDMRGGTFPLTDDNPQYYQRWIRLTLEAERQFRKEVEATCTKCSRFTDHRMVDHADELCKCEV